MLRLLEFEARKYPRLKPVHKRNDVRVVQLLQQRQLVIHHLLIPLDVFLEDDLDGDFARGAVRFTDDSVGPGALRVCALTSGSSRMYTE